MICDEFKKKNAKGTEKLFCFHGITSIFRAIHYAMDTEQTVSVSISGEQVPRKE
jgi:hypothetical protein